MANVDTFGHYLQEIGKYGVLPDEEVILYSRKVQTWLKADKEAEDYARLEREGKEAQKTLVLHNLKLVVNIAKKYRNHNVGILDLVQEGTFGLIRAIEKFDPERGYKFSTYSTWWIRQKIVLHFQTRVVKLSTHRFNQINAVKKATRVLCQELGRTPNLKEVAEYLTLHDKKGKKYTPDFLRKLAFYAKEALSLESLFSSTEGSSLLVEPVDDGPHNNIEKSLDQIDATERLIQALNPLQKQIITLRFGLEGKECMTNKEIAKELGIPSQTVSVKAKEALTKMRSYARRISLQVPF